MKKLSCIFCFFIALTSFSNLKSQTDADGLFMSKNEFCGGFLYGFSTWKNYWEGTFLRNNANIGNLQSQSVTAMANYGITNKLNAIVMAPYIANKATAGTLHAMSGIQDLTALLKYELVSLEKGDWNISAAGTIGTSLPLTKYNNDFFPLSIGTRSVSGFTRFIADIQWKKFYFTGSVSYIYRNNVKIARTAYYTTELIYSNEVKMPNAGNINLRIGWRQSPDFYVESFFDQWNTLGGFDMRKNDMPFVSNTMNASRIGLNGKLPIPKTIGLSFVGNIFTTVQGRNMGKASGFNLGFMYQFSIKKNKK